MEFPDVRFLKLLLTIPSALVNMTCSTFPDSIDPRIHQDVPVIEGKVEWLNVPKRVQIDSCDVSAGEIKSGLKNTYFVMRYHLKGELVGYQHRRPEIVKMLISEKFLIKDRGKPIFNQYQGVQTDPSSFEEIVEATIRESEEELIDIPVPKMVEAEISVLPIPSSSYDLNYNSEPLPFDLSMEKKTNLMQWDENNYHIDCGGFQKTVSINLLK